MKKIKISQLPLYSSLKGLFTIGTDANNRSVKVSLEFVEDAANKASDAADAATRSRTLTDTATADAKTATSNAKKATTAANEAADKAADAAKQAKTATERANEATNEAAKATGETLTARTQTEKATRDAQQATDTALETQARIQAMIDRLVPTGLSVKCLNRITLGNSYPIYITAELTPVDTLKNIIFISDNRAIEVATDGKIKVVSEGKSTVHIVPTCNTSLAKTVVIEVGRPTLRFTDIRSRMRLTQGGTMLLN